jgi:hypothetical protein
MLSDDNEVYYNLQEAFKWVSRAISEKRRQLEIINIWQSPGRSIFKLMTIVLISMLGILMIPLLFALVLPTLLILVFVIPGIFLFARWFTIIGSNDEDFNTGDMKVPTFYSSRPIYDEDVVTYAIMMSVIGVVFGGIHCIGWFFNFPSSDEAMLWRVSSAVLTGIAILIPLLAFLLKFSNKRWGPYFLVPLYIITLLVYVVSRLILLAEAFISIRHLTPGMLALVKWTSFIPHI